MQIERVVAGGKQMVSAHFSSVIRVADRLVLGLRFCALDRFVAISGIRPLYRWAPDHPALAEVDRISSRTTGVHARKLKAHCHGGGRALAYSILDYDTRVTGSNAQQ
jgi:hypothetical protein